MLSELVASSINPELKKIINSVDAALSGVQSRLEAQKAGGDPLTAVAAEQQLNALAAWRPALAEISASLDAPAAAAPHPPHSPRTP